MNRIVNHVLWLDPAVYSHSDRSTELSIVETTRVWRAQGNMRSAQWKNTTWECRVHCSKALTHRLPYMAVWLNVSLLERAVWIELDSVFFLTLNSIWSVMCYIHRSHSRSMSREPKLLTRLWAFYSVASFLLIVLIFNQWSVSVFAIYFSCHEFSFLCIYTIHIYFAKCLCRSGHGKIILGLQILNFRNDSLIS